MGKSTLVQAFGAELSQHGCVFAYGRCRDGQPAPYSAVADALGAMVRFMEAASAPERDKWRAELASGTSALSGVLGDLVPDVAHVLGETTTVTDLNAAEARRRLHRAAIRLISDTASFRPVTLAIDDLQWADRDSLLLLSELLTTSLRNVLVVGAHRSGGFDPAAAGLSSAQLRGPADEEHPHQSGRTDEPPDVLDHQANDEEQLEDHHRASPSRHRDVARLPTAAEVADLSPTGGQYRISIAGVDVGRDRGAMRRVLRLREGCTL